MLSLEKVYDHLVSCSTKWLKLGLQLGVSIEELNKIEYQWKNPDDCLIHMLDCWLKQQIKRPPPSWSALVAALNKESISENALANKLEELYITDVGPHSRSVNDSAVTSDESMSTRALTLPIVRPSSKNTISSTSSDNTPSSSSSVCALQFNFSHQNILLERVDDSAAISSLGSQDSSEASASYSSNRLSVERSSLDDFDSSKSQSCASKKCAFPYLDTQHLSESEKLSLIARLENDYQKINLEYGGLTYSLRESLVSQLTTPAKLADCLMDTASVPPTIKDEGRMLRDHYRAIKFAKDITEVFEILRNYHSFFDYHIIEYLVKHLGCDKVKKLLHAYKASFEDFCKRHVFECPAYSPKDSKSTDVVAKIEDGTDLNRFTLKSLKRFEVRLADILGIKSQELRVCGVEKGCLQITFQIPAVFEKGIFPLSPEKLKKLQLFEIMRLECGDYNYRNLIKVPDKKVQLSKRQLSLKSEPKLEQSPATSYASKLKEPPQSRQSYPAKSDKFGYSTARQKVSVGATASAGATYPRRPCINYMLLGSCVHGRQCWYSHEFQLHSPAEGSVFVDQISSLTIKTIGYTPSRKAYLIQIPRGRRSAKVRIVAEDSEAVEYVAFHELKASRNDFKPKAVCMIHKLTGACGNARCMYSHRGDLRKEEANIPLPRHLPPGYHTMIGKLCRTPFSRKFYILLKSDRDPEVVREIKVCAEDQETIHFVRENLFDCLDTKSQLTQIPRMVPVVAKPCPKQKLLGICPRSYCCEWNHQTGTRRQRPMTAYFQTEGTFAGRIAGCVGHGPDGGCYVIAGLSDKTKVEIIAETGATFKYVQRELTAKMGSLDTTPHTGYNYIHPEGVQEASNLILKFTKRDGSANQYQLVSKIAPESDFPGAKKQLTVEIFEHLNPPPIPPLYSRLVNLEKKMSLHPRNVQLRRDYRQDIHDRLRDGLTWMYENGLYPKLEGRFGKMSWRNCASLQDKNMDVERFVTYALKESRCRHCSFSAEIAGKGPAALKRSCIREIGFSDETYNFNLQTKRRNEGKLNIRVQFKDGKPKVILVKKSEYKVAMFDIICLHRENDIRVSLNAFEPASYDDPRIKSFIATLKMPEPNVIHFAPQAPDGEWTVTHIRHKKWGGYYFRDFKYVVSISTVGSYDIKEADLRQREIAIGPKNFGLKHEAELHNVVWECAFTGKLGLTSEQNTFLHLNEDVLPTQTIPNEWTPDMVMEDFEKDGFLQMMDDLNTAMHLVSV